MIKRKKNSGCQIANIIENSFEVKNSTREKSVVKRNDVTFEVIVGIFFDS